MTYRYLNGRYTRNSIRAPVAGKFSLFHLHNHAVDVFSGDGFTSGVCLAVSVPAPRADMIAPMVKLTPAQSASMDRLPVTHQSLINAATLAAIIQVLFDGKLTTPEQFAELQLEAGAQLLIAVGMSDQQMKEILAAR